MIDVKYQYKARLQLILLIHPDSNKKGYFEQIIYSYYNRDFNNPLNRGLGISVFFWNPFKDNFEILEKIIENSLHTFVIALIDSKMVLDRNWKTFLENLSSYIDTSKNHRLIPVNVDGKGRKISNKINRINFVRFHKFPKDKKEHFLQISLTNEICKMLFRGKLKGTYEFSDPVKLFLNYSRRTGEQHVKKLREYIHNNTALRTFFDVHDIPPGSKFEEFIYENIEKSCLLAFITDDYSSREWCRRELLRAKKCGCPVIVIDCLEGYDDRLFPYIGNTPVIRWSEKIKIIDIISIAMKETLRNSYNHLHLEYITNIWSRDTKNFQWFRAPEILTCVNLHHHLDSKMVNVLMYPDPPLGLEELALLVDSFPQLTFTTPTQFLSYKEKSDDEEKSHIIGFSIAESSDLPRNGLTNHHLIDTFVEFTRYILSTKANIAYGGDLRQHGFTQILFDLTRNHSKTDDESKSRVINFLAWPFHKRLTETEEADLSDVAEIRKIDLPKDLNEYNEVDPDPSTMEGRYLLSRSLTRMRKKANNEISCRVFLGGKRKNFRGKYPGLVEEVYLALINDKPIYLIGAFGGSAYDICKALLGIRNGLFLASNRNENERNFIKHYNQQISSLEEENIDYEKIFKFIEGAGFEGLKNGLTKEENEKLFESVHIFEIISLVLKGMKKIDLI